MAVSSRLSKLSSKKVPAAAPAPEAAPVKKDEGAMAALAKRKYFMKVAIIFGVVHIIFASIISIWGFHISIFKPTGADWIVRLAELPGYGLVALIGQSDNIESALPYIVAFVLNTIFYGGIGYVAGYFFKTYHFDEEINTLLDAE